MRRELRVSAGPTPRRILGPSDKWHILPNAPLRSKLIVTLVGPLLALMVLAGVVIRSSLVESDKAARVNERARFAGKLARERAAVDQMAATYRAAAARLDLGGDPGLQERVSYAMRELGKLQTQRHAVDAGPLDRGGEVEPGIEEGEVEGVLNVNEDHGPIVTPAEAVEQYTDTFFVMVAANTEIAPGSNNERLLEAVRASVALARAKEFAD